MQNVEGCWRARFRTWHSIRKPLTRLSHYAVAMASPLLSRCRGYVIKGRPEGFSSLRWGHRSRRDHGPLLGLRNLWRGLRIRLIHKRSYLNGPDAGEPSRDRRHHVCHAGVLHVRRQGCELSLPPHLAGTHAVKHLLEDIEDGIPFLLIGSCLVLLTTQPACHVLEDVVDGFVFLLMGMGLVLLATKLAHQVNQACFLAIHSFCQVSEGLFDLRKEEPQLAHVIHTLDLPSSRLLGVRPVEDAVEGFFHALHVGVVPFELRVEGAMR